MIRSKVVIPKGVAHKSCRGRSELSRFKGKGQQSEVIRNPCGVKRMTMMTIRFSRKIQFAVSDV